MTAFQFQAFISYSHKDEYWAKWLHGVLESFKVPRHLVGSDGHFGPLPSSLAPIFLDREEFSAANNLSDNIRAALEDSAALIVICSPDSAKSKWVNEEIKLFKSLGRSERIYTLIVAGDPDSPNLEDRCFAPALLIDESGNDVEPLAADAREWGDGKTLARQKITSSILGIRLDELRRRELKRKRKVRLFAGALASVFLAVSVTAFFSKQAEKNRRTHAETLVSEMVEISQDLESVVDLNFLKNISERLVSYLDTLSAEELSNESSLQISHVLRRLGKVNRLQGNASDAQQAFDQSREILQKLAERSPADKEILFELGQAEFWIGYLNIDHGKLELAEQSFNAYLEISEQLHNTEPGNAEWAMEMAFALSNLGVLEQRRVPVAKEKVLQYLEEAMDYNQLAVQLDPKETYYRAELSDSFANLGDAWLEVCDLQSALSAREKNVAYASEFYLKEPNNNRLKEGYSYSLAGLAMVEMKRGNIRIAIDYISDSISLLKELHRQDPSNLKLHWELRSKQSLLADMLSMNRENEASWALLTEIESGFKELISLNKNLRVNNAANYAQFLALYSDQAWRRGEYQRAKRLIEESRNTVAQLRQKNPESNALQHELYRVSYVWWTQHDRVADSEIKEVLASYQQSTVENMSCSQADIAAKVSLMQGNKVDAVSSIDYLQAKQYFDPVYIRFCQEERLCAN